MTVLALDLGFRLGYAFVQADKIPMSGSYPVGGSAEDLGVAGRSLDGIVRTLILKFRPTLIGYTTPWAGMNFDIEGMRPIIGFGMVVEMIADELKIPVRECNENAARGDVLDFVPKRREQIKAAVNRHCLRMGWPCKDEDAGDATIVGVYLLTIEEPQNAASMTPLFQSAAAKKKRRK